MSFDIYALSVIYFRDQHSPIPQQVLNDIMKMIARRFHGLSVDVLKPPLKLGGFGLIDLEQQLLGYRAKKVYNIICVSHYCAYISFRDKLQHLAIIITNIFHLHPSQRIVHVPIGNYGHSARDPDGNLVATEESSYDNCDNLLAQDHGSDGTKASNDIHLQVLDIKEEKLTVDSFKHFHKKFYEEKGNARTTTVFSTPSSNHQLLQTKVLSTFKWETFWLQLYKHQTQRPGYLEALQRFNLGHYKYKFPISPHHQQFPDKP
ncbi:hypothetical protein WICANDRAFT_63017 [Wickerhamomyces anomalus NRRL Y-366-8]|uniref:Uncharacterized protein n=1 Tax=Wickerhamomyces anomalus (strain ATCC 58044 / CBS 1984 / NCYC 433 / NRRL Y-366-8) TaxID=683960 RepID=A0A1E3P525_WICAA|nr:uncharacterized protein WICANDRAFT_63017 [Wickerhamomyces anomalus NRRL Y-366-8]ODQ60463.1 hypothetical protein WICANDRAFT_63017 [Wickerhamomyces anomalus NRRL Y-366-8]